MSGSLTGKLYNFAPKVRGGGYRWSVSIDWHVTWASTTVYYSKLRQPKCSQGEPTEVTQHAGLHVAKKFSVKNFFIPISCSSRTLGLQHYKSREIFQKVRQPPSAGDEHCCTAIGNRNARSWNRKFSGFLKVLQINCNSLIELIADALLNHPILSEISVLTQF